MPKNSLKDLLPALVLTGGAGAVIGGGSAALASDFDPTATAAGALGAGVLAPATMVGGGIMGARAGHGLEQSLKKALPEYFQEVRKFNRNPAAKMYSGPNLMGPGAAFGATAPSALIGAGTGHMLRPKHEKSAAYHAGCLAAKATLRGPNRIY